MEELKTMEDYINVSYDNNSSDLHTIVCGRERKITVAYVGKEAEELYKILTQQGYLHELLSRKHVEEFLSED